MNWLSAVDPWTSEEEKIRVSDTSFLGEDKGSKGLFLKLEGISRTQEYVSS